MSSLIDNIYTELSNLIGSSFDVCNKTFVNVFRFCSDWNINLMVAEMKLLAKKCNSKDKIRFDIYVSIA